MTTITFIEYNGEKKEIDAENGISLMQVALDNGVDGIDADCGGGCSCATCHVFIENSWFAKLPEIDAMEESMLGLNTMREDNSRLSCQIDITDELEGLVVSLPEFQG